MFQIHHELKQIHHNSLFWYSIIWKIFNCFQPDESYVYKIYDSAMHHIQVFIFFNFLDKVLRRISIHLEETIRTHNKSSFQINNVIETIHSYRVRTFLFYFLNKNIRRGWKLCVKPVSIYHARTEFDTSYYLCAACKTFINKRFQLHVFDNKFSLFKTMLK